MSGEEVVINVDENGNEINIDPVYQCNYCNRTFSTSQGLGGHQNSHRNERRRAAMIAAQGIHQLLAPPTIRMVQPPLFSNLPSLPPYFPPFRSTNPSAPRPVLHHIPYSSEIILRRPPPNPVSNAAPRGGLLRRAVGQVANRYHPYSPMVPFYNHPHLPSPATTVTANVTVPLLLPTNNQAEVNADVAEPRRSTSSVASNDNDADEDNSIDLDLHL